MCHWNGKNHPSRLLLACCLPKHFAKCITCVIPSLSSWQPHEMGTRGFHSGARETACPLCLTFLQIQHPYAEPVVETSAHLEGLGGPGELMHPPSGFPPDRKSTSSSMKWGSRIYVIPTRVALTHGPRPPRRACAPPRESSVKQRRSCRS